MCMYVHVSPDTFFMAWPPGILLICYILLLPRYQHGHHMTCAQRMIDCLASFRPHPSRFTYLA